MQQVNIGIDLGTTNSLIAGYYNGEVIVYKNPIGFKETLPSVVAFRPDRTLVGDKAREYLNADAVNVFSSFKRKMGTDEKYYIVNKDENISPIELSSMVLKELKQFVPSNTALEAAVITIPASFNTMQSNATLKAGELAGFKKVFLLQEPIAAALAYFNQKNKGNNANGNWLVYDFGGGTFDVALVQVNEDGMKIIDNEGNNFLGGVDLDYLIVEHIITPAIEEQLGKENFITALTEKYGTYEKLYYQLLYYAEEAKKELSIKENTFIEFTTVIDNENKNFSIPISAAQISTLFLPKVNETINFIHQLLENNKLTTKDIQQIILVGGSTYNKVVKEQLAAQTNIAINAQIDPTTAIAVGAGYYASNKFYQPTIADADSLINSALSNIAAEDFPFTITLSYSNSSRDTEEVLLIKCDGDVSNYNYRITRSDGGFDTGIAPLKSRKTEFLQLIPQHTNSFSLKVYDENNTELNILEQTILIHQGKFTIDGQPLPNDICIEVDDIENKTTKLEVVFERNSLLPQKRTLYKTISKHITKGSNDNIIINIIEGERNARPSSNLPIGVIEIKGKDLTVDLVRGSDIEIKLQIDESRILTTNVYLVMSKQEFNNVFAVAEKVVSLDRLREQCNQLENDLRDNLQEYQYYENTSMTNQCEQMLEEVMACNKQLHKITHKDNSDTKFIIAEKIWHISQKADKLGGLERIGELIERYSNVKDEVLLLVENVDFNKDKIKQELARAVQGEEQILRSKNASVIQNGIKKISEVGYLAHSYNNSVLVSYLEDWKTDPPENFTHYNTVQQLFAKADAAIAKDNYVELRSHLVSIYNLSKQYKESQGMGGFSGTGIG